MSSFRGSITGRRAHVIIVDDPHDIGDDIDRIEATVDTFNTVLLSRLNNRKTGRVLVVAHRVHEFDLSAYLSQNKRWRHVVLPLVATRDQTYKVTSGDWVRRKGDILRPDTFDPEDITELRESAFNRNFEMLYQQNYDSQTSPPIDASHFDGIVDPSTSSGPIVLSVDAGMTNTKRSAYSVIQVWRLMDEYYDLIDQFREQADFMDFRAELRRHRRILYRPVAILIRASRQRSRPSSRTWRASIKLLWCRSIRMAVPSQPGFARTWSRSWLSAYGYRLTPCGETTSSTNLLSSRTESLPTRSTPLRNFSIMRLGSWVSEVLGRRAWRRLVVAAVIQEPFLTQIGANPASPPAFIATGGSSF